MSLFPIFLKLEGRRCLVVGAGAVGEDKIRGLLAAGAAVYVVALRAPADLQVCGNYPGNFGPWGAVEHKTGLSRGIDSSARNL